MATSISMAAPTSVAPATPTPVPQAAAARGLAGTLNLAIASLGPKVFVSRLSQGFSELSLVLTIADPIISLNPKTRALEDRWVKNWSFRKVGTDIIWSFNMMPGVTANEGTGVMTSEDAKFNWAQTLEKDARSSAGGRTMVDNDTKNLEVAGPNPAPNAQRQVRPGHCRDHLHRHARRPDAAGSI